MQQQQLPRLAREQPCLPSSWPRSHDEATAEPLACPRGKHLPVSAQTCVTSARYSRHGRVPFFLFALLALELPAADAEIDQQKHGVFICIVAHTCQLTGSMRDTILAHNKTGHSRMLSHTYRLHPISWKRPDGARLHQRTAIELGQHVPTEGEGPCSCEP